MGGIAGYVGIEAPELLHRMNRAQEHRGPDGRGLFHERDVSLGHRRLALVDSEDGHQPFFSEDEKLVLVVDGALYNLPELRHEFPALASRCQTGSDLEVIVHLWREKGPEALTALDGDFALALYDREAHQMFLARDRLGVRPLHYAVHEGALLFASELSAVLAGKDPPRRLDPDVLDAFFTWGWVPGPATLMRGIHRLPPAHWAVFESGSLELQRYWDPANQRSTDPALEVTESTFSDRLAHALKRRLEVPASLRTARDASPGSDLLAAALARTDATPGHVLAAMSAPSGNSVIDERDREGGSTEGDVNSDALRHLPEIIRHLGSPTADLGVVTLFSRYRDLRTEARVVLTPAGATSLIPGTPASQALLALADASPGTGLLATLRRRLPRGNLARRLRCAPHPRLESGLALFRQEGPAAAWRHLREIFSPREKELLYSHLVLHHLSADEDQVTPIIDATEVGRLHDQLLTWSLDHALPDEVLLHQDRLSMAHGLESRSPFLDHHLVELLFAMPSHRRLPLERVQPELRERMSSDLERYLLQSAPPAPPPPTPRWLTHPHEDPVLREILEDTLSLQVLARRSFFVPTQVTDLKDRLLAGESALLPKVTALLTFELWCRAFLDR